MGSALCFPCSGQRPAGDGEKEPLASPMDAMFPSAGTSLGSGSYKEAGHGGELLWAVRASQRSVSQKKQPLGAPRGWRSGRVLQRVHPQRGAVGAGDCGLLRWDTQVVPGLGVHGTAHLGMPAVAHTPREQRGHRGCSQDPGTAPAASPVWLMAPGQRRGPVRPGYTGSELAHDARRGAKG